MTRFRVNARASSAGASSSNYSGLVVAEPDNRLKLVGLFCLIALHNRLFHAIDKKLLNKIWELCKKVCICEETKDKRLLVCVYCLYYDGYFCKEVTENVKVLLSPRIYLIFNHYIIRAIKKRNVLIHT